MVGLGRRSSVPIVVMTVVVATTKRLKVTTTSVTASEIHVSSTSLRRVVGIRIKRWTLSKILLRIALIIWLRKGSRRGLMVIWILVGEAIARLSHMTSTLVVKSHTNRRAHERCFMTSTSIRKTATTTIIIERWSILRWTLPLLWRTSMRWLVRGDTVPIRRRLRVLEWLRWLLRTILWLLSVGLRSVVGMVVLCLQGSSLGLLHRWLLRVMLLLWRTMMRWAMLLSLATVPLRVVALGRTLVLRTTLRARSLRAYVGTILILLTIRSRIAIWRTLTLERTLVLRWALTLRGSIETCIRLLRIVRNVVNTLSAASATARSKTTTLRLLILRLWLLRISVLRMLLLVVRWRRAGWRRWRRIVVLLSASHLLDVDASTVMSRGTGIARNGRVRDNVLRLVRSLVVLREV